MHIKPISAPSGLSARRGIRVCMLVLCLLQGVVLAADAAPATPAVDGGLDAAVIPALRAQVMRAAGPLSSYRIVAALDPDQRTIAGDEEIAYRNATGAPQSALYLRLYPNAPYYSPGGLTLAAVRIGDGATVSPALSVDDTVAEVPLAAPLAPGATVRLSLHFSTTIPADSHGSFGILNDDTRDGTWVLADWYPIVAGYEPARGWRLDPPTSFGDPTFADEALYDVTLVTPAALTVVTSGSQVGPDATASGGTVRRRFVDGPARDFTFVAAGDYVAFRTRVGGTTVSAYANPDGVAGARIALATAAAVLAAYSAHLGSYPFAELDLVEAPLAGAAGVSWTGLVFLNNGSLRINPGDQGQVDALRFTVAHEVGHQWWGMSVGANSNDHAFMVEGLTNYTAFVALAWTEGAAASEAALERYAARPYLALLANGQDQIADVPIADGQDAAIRSTIIYGKAALGFLAIRERIGDDAFFRALRAYAATYAYRIATPADLRAAFETASGQDLGALWQEWFDAATTTPQQVEAVVAAARQ